MKKSSKNLEVQSKKVGFDGPTDLFQNGDIVVAQIGDELGIAQIKKEIFIPSLELRKIPEPHIENGVKCEWIVWLHKHDPETRERLESLPVCLISGTQAQAEKEFSGINKQYKAHLTVSGSVLSPDEVRAHKAMVHTLKDMAPETIKAADGGNREEAEIAFSAEKYLVTGEIEGANKKVVDATHKWSRRVRRIDAIKKELSTGWVTKRYNTMGGDELTNAIKDATGYSVPIKTLRSSCASLSLTSHWSVRPGPKNKSD